jgi:DNA-binding NarL/FixJ family response regulator
MIKHHLTLLLVDDNSQFAERMNWLLNELEKVGEIKTSSSYEAAINILNIEVPDLVLLDIHLPGKSGIELLKWIKRSGRSCRVMMLTNQADEYYQKLCLRLGADYFLDKSRDFPLIPDIIRNMKM